VKPTSIVSLIIAVLITIVGLVTCIIAQNMAKANGEQLFADRTDGNTTITKEFDPKNLERISITFSSGKVNIYGNCDDRGSEHYSSTCKLEIVNIAETDFVLNKANTKLEFNETLSLDRLKFWENGFTFKGMRYILTVDQFKSLFNKDKQEPEKEKQINLFLTRAATEALAEDLSEAETEISEAESETAETSLWKLNQVTIKATGAAGCDVSIQNVQIDTDYIIYSNRLKLTVKNVSTNTAIRATEGLSGSDSRPKSTEVFMEDVSVKFLNLQADELKFTSSGLRFTEESEGTENMKLAGNSGRIRLGTVDCDELQFNLDFSVVSTGTILVNNVPMSNPYKGSKNSGSGNPLYTVSVDVGDADVTILTDGSHFREDAAEEGTEENDSFFGDEGGN
jgi:hypothetical protein